MFIHKARKPVIIGNTLTALKKAKERNCFIIFGELDPPNFASRFSGNLQQFTNIKNNQPIWFGDRKHTIWKEMIWDFYLSKKAIFNDVVQFSDIDKNVIKIWCNERVYYVKSPKFYIFNADNFNFSADMKIPSRGFQYAVWDHFKFCSFCNYDSGFHYYEDEKSKFVNKIFVEDKDIYVFSIICRRDLYNLNYSENYSRLKTQDILQCDLKFIRRHTKKLFLTTYKSTRYFVFPKKLKDLQYDNS